ncbi:SelT/SelW/SelH family protein [Marinobacter sp.]|uniref:SelT/SelW/SelH family protein n=1 Tax=Marinobacter sp. TaxID=50741 RepID=UPI002B271843|nr:SelT/SelW/SelH family protein [Marinobacter sp.]
MATRITLHYCTGCNWLLRSAWMAQELLTTFDGMIDELTLKPGDGGIFEVYVNSTRIWSRKEQGGFPEIKQLKQLVRDEIAPDHSLGHSDSHTQESDRNS